ncbi:MAG: TolC family protein [Acidobacteria bacterium]|nr:TolC family protein [Acidobacteriota bacterium]
MMLKSFEKSVCQPLTVCFVTLLVALDPQAQSHSSIGQLDRDGSEVAISSNPMASLTQYVDPLRGTSVEELVQTALARNAELLATRQRTAEAQGLLLQAGFPPNPGFEVSVTNGSILGSLGEREISLSFAHTFELGGKRDRRVEVAQLGTGLAQLEIADRERQLKADLKARYGEALAAVRNLETAVQLLEVNQQGYRLTQARVNQGEAAAYEQGLLQVEVGRLESDRLLFENQVTRALLELKTLTGMNLDEPLRLKGDLSTLPAPTLLVEEAIERALSERPDLKAARVDEELGEAEIRLARAEAVPNAIGFGRYTRSSARFDQFGLSGAGSLVPIRDTDNLFTAGVSITLPTRNRNQGNIQAAVARREAARLRRQFIEQVVRREVNAAYSRYVTARQALEIFDQRVLGQSQDNLRIIRAGYNLGEWRVFDVINEQRRLIDTQKAYTDVLKEYYLALVELERAVGAPIK